MLKNVIIGCIMLILSFGFFSCDSSGTSGNIILEGVISNSSQFGDMTAIVLQGNSRLGSVKVSSEGNFVIRFGSSTNLVTLRFESATFNAERPNIQVIDQSVTNLDITLQQNPTLIVIDRWQVFQNPISLSGTQIINYNESQAEFNLNGDGGNCIFAGSNSVINYTAMSISITNCREGVRAQSSASIVLNADQGIQISSNRDAIVTTDDGFVEVGQTANPTNNTIVIQSFNQFGINAAGNSIVDINPQNACSISGNRGAVNVNGSAVVNTSSCTLSN